MRGSLRERSPGVWQIRAYVGRTDDGRTIHKSRTIHGGRRKAEDALRKLQDEVRDGKHRTTRGTIANLLDRYITHLEGRGASPSTLRTYRSYIYANINPAIGGVDLTDIDPETLDELYTNLIGRGLAPSTVRQHHAILSGAFKQARKWRLIEANPAELATPPAVRAGEVVPPTVDQVHQLLTLAEQRNPTLAVLLFVAATTGARRGELCAIRWSGVDLDGHTLTISESAVDLGSGGWRVKDTKAHKTGRIALDDATVAVLTVHRTRVLAEAAAGGVTLAADAFVFSQTLSGGESYRPGRVTGFFRSVRTACGLPHVKLHHLRHFMATQALAAGMDVLTVAGRLRHDPVMTLRVYGYFMEERDREIAAHMGSLMARPAPTED